MDDLLKQLRSHSLSLEKELISLRRMLHQHPETGWSEFQTSKLLQQHLVDAGLPTPEGMAGTGFYLDIKGQQDGPLVAYRADMDALPIQDRKEVSYASQRNGFGHLCGHDVHSTIAAAVARTLHQHRNMVKGTVRVFWQPAEEITPSGAPRVLKEGVLDGVEAVYGIHCDPTIPSGHFSARPGPETGSFDTFEVTVDAPSTAHSARPYEGNDTIWIAHQIVHHLYQMIGRVTDVRKPGVLSICAFHAGDALNVIPHHVTFGGTIRTMDEQLRQQLREYIRNITISIGRMNDVEADVRFGEGAPSVINNPQLHQFIRRIITTEVGDDRFPEREQSIGAEDFAYYTQKIPGLFMRVGTAHAPETMHPLHHSLFDIDERVIAPVSALMAYTLIRHLREQVLHARSQSD
ncbi:amidohydrolase [Balneolales bacterium ANBcel1]|nr:amidohydrolase [Balneolales bacterium ANBcel1]